MQVENLNDKVKGVFLVKSIDEVGHEEVFFQDLDLQTQLFTVQLDFDKEKKYMHEVSIIAPWCTVNGERQSYTFHVQMPCFAVAEAIFQIQCD